MAQQQYLSTDPLAGLDEQYLSTDPLAGDKPEAQSLLRRFLGDPGTRRPDRVTLEQSQQGGASGAAVEGASQAAAQGLALPLMQAAGRGAKKLFTPLVAKPLMRLAYGAQSKVRDAFPTVDLEAVTLREGLTVPNRKGAEALGQKAGTALKQANEAADAGGVPALQPRELMGPFRKIHSDAVLAKRPDLAEATIGRANQMRRELRGGLSMQGSQARKEVLQREAKAALNASTPKEAAFTPQLANAERGAIASAMRGRSPEIASALTRSQEMLAVQKAMKAAAKRPAVLRALVSAASGGAGWAYSGDPMDGLKAAAAPMIVSSPRALSGIAQAVHHGASPITQASIMAVISRFLAANQHGKDGGQ